MKTVHRSSLRARGPSLAAARQRGVIMIVTLLALVILLIGSAALVRSFNASLFMAGNLAFKRDLVNQAERASTVVLTQMTTGALEDPATRESNDTALNYSASILPTNAQGIPNALLSDAAFAAVGVAGNDIVVAEQGVTLRYVVDRLCNATGSELALGPAANCSVGLPPDARGGSASEMNRATRPPQVLYRLSVRADGPRNTQAYFQTTFAL
jgi:hypothetical protein